MTDSQLIVGADYYEMLPEVGRCSWEPVSPYRIAVDIRGGDNFSDIWVYNADGSGGTNITDGHASLPGFHCGNPEWNPAGTFIVFTAQRIDLADDELGNPGVGVFNDVYVYKVSNGAVTLLYTSPTPADASAPGSIHPHFNHDGTKLCWARRLSDDAAGFSSSGVWDIVVADFDGTGTPSVSNLTGYQPGLAGAAIAQPCFHETHGFNKDSTKILYTANPLSGQNQIYMDIFEATLGNAPNATARTRLTQTSSLSGEPSKWDEHAHYAPDGRSIIWGPADTLSPFVGDWWIMDADGDNKRRLTYFGIAGHDHHDAYVGRDLYASEGSWAADGTRFVGRLYDPTGPGGDGPLVVLTFTFQPTKPANAARRRSFR